MYKDNICSGFKRLILIPIKFYTFCIWFCMNSLESIWIHLTCCCPSCSFSSLSFVTFTSNVTITSAYNGSGNLDIGTTKKSSVSLSHPSLYNCSPYDVLISTFLLFHSPRRLHRCFIGSSNFFKKVAFRSILLKTRDPAMSKKLTASPSHFWTTQIGA